MAGKGGEVKAYELTPAFERVVAGLLASRPKFFGVLGYELEPQKFAQEPARLVVRAAQAVAADVGRGPAAPVLVVQRLRRWMAEGTVTAEQLDAVVDLLEEATHDPPDEAQVVAELVPVVRQHMQNDAVRAAIEEYGRHGDFARVVEIVERARKLGTHDRSQGSKLTVGVLESIGRLRAADRLATGVLELDMQLNGGLARGHVGMVVAGAKAGKSFFLTHQIAHAIAQGHFVLEATLELSENDQQTRLVANLTNLPIDAIVDGSAEAQAAAALERLLPSLGVYRVKFFPAVLTRLAEVFEWVREMEAEEGRKVDLLVVDYIDKVGAADRRLEGSYQIQGATTEEFRLYCHGRGIWGWTASQPKRRDAKDRNKRIDIDDVADSQNKVRVVDLILTMHRPSEAEVEFYVAGNRHGRDKFGVGPLPHNLVCGQLIPAG